MSDTNAGNKIKIPDEDFFLCAILLKIDLALRGLRK